MTTLKKQKLLSVDAVIRNRICCGCGTCTVVCPTSAITFIFGARFNYPKVDKKKCNSCKKCLEVCPSSFLLQGTELDFKYEIAPPGAISYLINSTDINIRREASSGGFITGLLIYLLESKKIDGCVVTRCEGNNPLVAESFIANNKQAIISATGSKYTPVSSCIMLKDIIKQPGQYAFVGTPCMVEGLTRLEKSLPEISTNIVLKIGFVCSGVASRLSTKKYMEKQGNISAIGSRRICYRGNGWPGRFRVFGDGDKLLMDRPYIGGSSRYVVAVDHYIRCNNCLDHWAYFADIVVSDPWSEEMIISEKIGRSAVLVKNERGENAILPAIKGGYLTADVIPVRDMIDFNKHLLIAEKIIKNSWMPLYQLLFLHRVKYLLPILRSMLNRQLNGVITTLKALLNKNYYY